MPGADNLVERSDVVDAADRLLAAARTGAGGALFVVAEAGLGKTAVLDRTRAAAEEQGFVVGFARGDAMETSLPFGVVAQAFRSAGGVDVLAGAPAGSSSDARVAAFYAALRWLDRRGGPPVVLALDDLQWADADSLAMVSFLARRLDSLPVALLGTLRPWPRAALEMASGLAHDGHAAIERLAPLTEGGTASLLADRVGRRVPDAEVEAGWRVCGGNPLLLEQVALSLARGGTVPSGRQRGNASAADTLLLSRFAGVPADALRFAQAASVLGTRFQADVAWRLAGLDEAGAESTLDALGRSGLVRTTGAGEVEFAHPLFGQALYDDIPAPARARLHARAFALLVERGLEAEAADHAVHAGLVGDPAAVAVLSRVGVDALTRGAFETAVTVLETAVDFAGDHPPAELLLDHGRALVSGGRARDAVETCERVLRRKELTPITRAHAERLLARALVYIGSYDAASARFESAAETAKTVDPAFAVETLVAHAAEARIFTGPANAVPVTARAREIAAGCADEVRRRADTAWALCAIETGDPGGIGVAAAAARAVQADPLSVTADVSSSFGVLTAYSLIAKYTEALDVAERIQRTALRAAAASGMAEEEAFLAITTAETATRRLDLQGATALLEQARGLADLVPVSEPFADVARALVLQLQGRPDDSAACARSAEPVVSALGLWSASLWLSLVAAWRLGSAGHLDDACSIYADIEATTTQVGLEEPCLVPWADSAVAAYVAHGRTADAARVVGWLDSCASSLPCRYPRIAAATGRALLAEAAGERATADELFATALGLHREVDLPLQRLQTLLAYGRFLRRSGQPKRARPLFADALALADAGGAEWLAAQARDELRVVGGRRRRGTGGSDQLTAQERRVAELAAAGARNPDIARQLYLSVRTVETHLQRIYLKLGIHSRRELRSAVTAGDHDSRDR